MATYILRDSRRSMLQIKAEALSLMRSVLPEYLMKIFPELKTVESNAKKDGYLDVAEVQRIMEVVRGSDGGGSGGEGGKAALAEALAAASAVFDGEGVDDSEAKAEAEAVEVDEEEEVLNLVDEDEE